jgi:hypothetical protein
VERGRAEDTYAGGDIDETLPPGDEGEVVQPDFSVGSVSTPKPGMPTPVRTPGAEVAIPPSVQAEVKKAQKKRLRIDQSTVISSACVCVIIAEISC